MTVLDLLRERREENKGTVGMIRKRDPNPPEVRITAVSFLQHLLRMLRMQRESQEAGDV